MATNTLSHSVQVAGHNAVVVVTEAVSKDMLVSYINFLRQRMNLPPITIDPELDKEAEEKAKSLRQHHNIRVDRDRSMYSIVKSDEQFWIRQVQPAGRFQYRIATPSIDSDTYLSYVFNHKYSSIGTYLYRGIGESPETYLVQVFSEGRGKS